MLAIGQLALYLAAGVLIVRWLLPRHSPLTRVWLGLSLGVLLMMWLPALFAFAFGFTRAAHWAALAALVPLTLCAYLARDRRAPAPWDRREGVLLRQILLVCVPLTLLSAWLQYTHVMRVDANGDWYVGQSTYGDLPMHLSFITGLKNAPFPPEYPFYPGHRLSYPFLTDSFSTSFYLFGLSLQAAAILPALLMMSLTFMGVMCLTRELTAGKKTVVLAALLFFLNGGLGFLYDMDQAAGYEADGTLTVMDRLDTIMTGYYKTPTNQPDPNNLRWSNLIADLLVPQRTLMGGYSMAVPCIFLLWTAFAPDTREKLGGFRARILLGLWAGLLPLVHTHSFAAVGLMSLGFLLYDLVKEKGRVGRCLAEYAEYGAVAVLVAAPQLVFFTFHQALGGAPGSFIRFQFNWVNNPGGGGMRDFYLFFYLKNIGLPFAALLLALLEPNAKHRRIFAGAAAVILAAEFIRFQPNEYDNNKLLYLAWLLCAAIAADWFRMIWHRLKGLRARPVLAAAAAVTVFLSAGLSLARECVSNYMAFDRESVETAEWIKENTEEHSVFLTGTRQHLNPVDSIAGRTIVCGPDLWLYWHGFDTGEANADIMRFYTEPLMNLDVLEKYGVDYVYVSDHERVNYGVDTDAIDAVMDRVYEANGDVIWKVPEG